VSPAAVSELAVAIVRDPKTDGADKQACKVLHAKTDGDLWACFC
jgi:hypothetical protein